MSVTDERTTDPDDLAAKGVRWDIATLLDGSPDVEALLDAADQIADELVATGRGRIAEMSATELIAFHRRYAEMLDRAGRAGDFAQLTFAANTSDPKNGALVAKVQERVTAMSTKLLFIELEWAEASDEHVDSVLADPHPRPAFTRHHLRSARRYRPHLLSEPEERILTEKSVVGASAWAR